MRRSALLLSGLLLLAAAPGCSRGGGSRTATATKAPTAEAVFVAIDPNSTSPTDRAITEQQDELRARPDDRAATLALANSFLLKARETGDPTFYAKSEGLLRRLTDERDDDPAVLVAQGELALARHEFADALRLGKRAVEQADGFAAALGVVVDASNELGRYDDALEATQAMVDAKPNQASLARVSYARELRGDLDGAIAAMSQAVTAGAGSGENLAYVQVQLGNLLLAAGDITGAASSYADAEASFPGFALPLAGKARVLVAQGDPAGAAVILADVVDRLPTAEHAAALGDALAAAGKDAEATEAYALVDAINQLSRANGVNIDVELALFEADHRPGRAAVARAKKGFERRPALSARDALAWNLFRAGDEDAAASHAARVVELGTIDPLYRFHAAEIAFAQGERDDAATHLQLVLDGNPRFSAAHAARVEELARELDLDVPPATP